MGGLAKDFLIGTAIGTAGMFVAKVVQHLVGGSHWLPSGDEAYAWSAAAYWFSRYPIWERR